MTYKAACRDAVLQTTDSDTLSLFQSGDRFFLLSCAHVVLSSRNDRLALRLPDGLAAVAKRIYLRNGSILHGGADTEGDCCLVEIDATAVGTHPLLKTLKAAPLPEELASVDTTTAVAGISVHGECHGFVQQPPQRPGMMLMQGVAGPGNSGTALYSRNGLVGVLAGIDGESTALPVQIGNVAEYSLTLTRALDQKRYAVVRALDGSALSAACHLSTAPTAVDLDQPVMLDVVQRTGEVVVPGWLRLASSLPSITYRGGH